MNEFLDGEHCDMVMLLGSARWATRQIEKVSPFYDGLLAVGVDEGEAAAREPLEVRGVDCAGPQADKYAAVSAEAAWSGEARLLLSERIWWRERSL